MKQLQALFIFFILLLGAAMTLVFLFPELNKGPVVSPEDRKGGKDMVIKNYGDAIDSAAVVFKVSPAYLKALCMLECSGMKVFNSRFEPHVYKRLKKVKSGELPNYEHVTGEMLFDANDEALKNLASSWGPFQLMGYKCLLLGIKVRDIRGEMSVIHGVKWIDKTYGDLLRENKYRDAFHIHNTGIPYPRDGKPRTHDPKYCDKGLAYMKYFEGK